MSNRTNQNRRKLAAIKRAAQAKSAVSMLDFLNEAQSIISAARPSYSHALIQVIVRYQGWSTPSDPSKNRVDSPSFQLIAASVLPGMGVIEGRTPADCLQQLKDFINRPPAPQVAEFDTKAEVEL